MKKFRKTYESKIRQDDFIPTEEQFTNYEQDLRIEVKELDGCKIEFVLKQEELIGALLTDPEFKAENEKMDSENMLAAWNNFESWLKS